MEIISRRLGGSYGNRVVIDHGMQRGVPVATSYNLMQRIAVKRWPRHARQVIGYEGRPASARAVTCTSDLVSSVPTSIRVAGSDASLCPIGLPCR